MRCISGKLFLAVCVLACSPCVFAADQERDEKFKISFVRGYDVASVLPDSDYQASIKRMFRGEEVEFYLQDGGYTETGLLPIIKSSNIFYINTHSGDSETEETQVIKVKLPSGGDPSQQYLTPDEIRAAVGTDGGPKLVIINGCNTTDYHLGNAQRIDRRLATGFGIGPNAKGRAYLGWQSKVVAGAADKYLADKLLKAWTTAGYKNHYPTLKEAHEKAGRYSAVNRLNIVGDANLRYDFIRGYIGKVPIKGVWKLKPPEDPEKQKDLAMWLALRFVLTGQGRIYAYSPLDANLKSTGLNYWRLDGDYTTPQITLIQCDENGKRQQVFSAPLSVNPDSPNRIGLVSGEDTLWFIRDRNTR
ncbi:hypothetical protein Pan153_06830 [Gimesia panareensis]|uniref:Uncharacterized protein n=1 Tax=Gimesia panareensis TaxID=2527978 RepID=A0A518FIA0_9PLAN|nr:hypothetical protein [Gimesia panareensis]QDV16062.1 hypothetical protein Pan153_06830 [Gimesia panareensis]